jgi:hypothetical protein
LKLNDANKFSLKKDSNSITIGHLETNGVLKAAVSLDWKITTTCPGVDQTTLSGRVNWVYGNISKIPLTISFSSLPTQACTATVNVSNPYGGRGLYVDGESQISADFVIPTDDPNNFGGGTGGPNGQNGGNGGSDAEGTDAGAVFGAVVGGVSGLGVMTLVIKAWRRRSMKKKQNGEMRAKAKHIA